MTLAALEIETPERTDRALERDIWALEITLKNIMRDHDAEELNDMLTTMGVDAVLQKFLETIYPGEE